MSMTWFSEYADRGALADLSGYAGETIDLSALDEDTAESGRTDEGLFGIGQSSITQATFRNPDLAAEHGIELPESWSWEDFRAVGAEFAEAAGEGMYGTTDAGGDFQLFAVWARQHGTDLFDGDTLAVGADLIEEWLVMWEQLREEGIAPPPDVSAESDSFETSQFSQLHTVVTFGWVQQITFFQPLLPDHGLVPGDVPGASAGDLSGQYLKALDFWCILATSQKQDEAAELLDFLITSPEAATSIGLTLGVPPSQAARDALGADPDTAEGRAIEYVERVRAQVGPSPDPWPPGYGSLQGTEFGKINQDVAFGKSTPSTAAKAFVETAAGVLGA
jgi:multiple sugar transport system substrate-binding protein